MLYYNTLRFFVIVKLSSMFIDLVELYPVYTISKIIKYEIKCLYKKFKLIQTYICLRPTLCTLLTSEILKYTINKLTKMHNRCILLLSVHVVKKKNTSIIVYLNIKINNEYYNKFSF